MSMECTLSLSLHLHHRSSYRTLAGSILLLRSNILHRTNLLLLKVSSEIRLHLGYRVEPDDRKQSPSHILEEVHLNLLAILRDPHRIRLQINATAKRITRLAS